MSDTDDSYRRREHEALCELAERTLADPDADPKHVEAAIARLSSPYVDVEQQIHLIGQRDPQAIWALDAALQKIRAALEQP